MRLEQGTARQYDVVGARVLAEVLLARPTRGGMASVSIRADSADCDYRTIRKSALALLSPAENRHRRYAWRG